MRLPHRSAGGLRSRGFVLAAVLWLLAGLTILVASVSVSMMAVARTNRDLNARVNLMLAEQRATAALSYLVLSTKLLGSGANVAGLVLALDDSVHFSVDGGATVELQDVQGLLGLNAAGGDNLRRLLIQCGATEAQAGGLVDKLLDYTDEDSFKRLNGAEAFEYAARALPAPRNDVLASPAELWQVMDWPAIRESWSARQCDEQVSLSPLGMVNLWTAPAPVLRAIGMDAAQADAALAERRLTRGLQQLSPLLLAFRDAHSSLTAAQGLFAVRSRGEVRVTVSLAPGGLRRRFVMSRGGPNDVIPFLISSPEWLPAKSAVDPESRAPVEQVLVEDLAKYVTAVAARSSLNDVQAFPLPFQRP